MVFVSRVIHEANLPTLKNQALARSWISHAHAHARWPQGDRGPARQGSQAPLCLNGIVARVTGATPPRQRLGFGAERRIRSKAEYDSLLRGGTRRTFAGFTFFVAPNGAGSARLGVVMSLRVSRLANVRNYVKRCIREAFRLEQQALAPIDVLVRPPQNFRPERDMLARLRNAFSRLKP